MTAEFFAAFHVPTLEACAKLPTPRLLALFKKKRSLRWAYLCDCCGIAKTEKDARMNEACNAYMDGVKDLLDQREHVTPPRTAEANPSRALAVYRDRQKKE